MTPLLIALVLTVVCWAPAAAQYAYITNETGSTVSMIDTTAALDDPIEDIVVDTITVAAGPIGVAINSLGTRMYPASAGAGRVAEVNVARAVVVRQGSGGTTPAGVAISADDATLYVVDAASAAVSVVDTATMNNLGAIAVGNSPFAIALRPGADELFVSNLADGTVSIVDTVGEAVTGTVTGLSGPRAIAFSPDGSTAYVAEESAGRVAVVDAAAGTVTTTVPVGAAPWGVAVTPDGTRVYATNSADDTASVIEVASLSVVATIPVGDEPYGIDVHPDGTRAYAVNHGEGTVSVIDVAGDVVAGTIPVGAGAYALGRFIAPETPCSPRRVSGCRGANTAKVSFKIDPLGRRSKFKFKWSKGSYAVHSYFGNPLTTTDYAVCVYDDDGLVFTADIPAHAFKWREMPDERGFQYKDKVGLPDGITKIKLQPGASGKSKGGIGGKGPSLPAPLLPLPWDPNVYVQLRSSDARCFRAAFGNSHTKKNEAEPGKPAKYQASRNQ